MKICVKKSTVVTDCPYRTGPWSHPQRHDLCQYHAHMVIQEQEIFQNVFINHPEELIVHHPNSSNQQDVSFTVITMSRLISIQKSFFSGAIVKLSENHPGYQHWTNLSQLNHCQSICQIHTKYKERMHKNTLEIK